MYHAVAIATLVLSITGGIGNSEVPDSNSDSNSGSFQIASISGSAGSLNGMIA